MQDEFSLSAKKPAGQRLHDGPRAAVRGITRAVELELPDGAGGGSASSGNFFAASNPLIQTQLSAEVAPRFSVVLDSGH